MLVVDSSVAVKWFLDETGRAEALELIGSDRLAAPELIFAEAANVAWKAARRGNDAAGLRRGLLALPRLIDLLVPLEELRMEALTLSIAHDHPAYDGFYVALARREAAPLVTADAGLARRFSGVAEIRLLGG